MRRPLGEVAGCLRSRVFIRHGSGLNDARLAALPNFLVLDRVLVLAGCEHSVAHTACVVGKVDADVVRLVSERAILLVVWVQDHMGLLLHSDGLGHCILIIFLAVVGSELVLVLQE